MTTDLLQFMEIQQKINKNNEDRIKQLEHIILEQAIFQEETPKELNTEKTITTEQEEETPPELPEQKTETIQIKFTPGDHIHIEHKGWKYEYTMNDMEKIKLK